MARCPACSEVVTAGRFCPACGAPLTHDSEAPTRLSPPSHPSPSSSSGHGRFLPGAILGGRYRIVALLGKGGMGEVYRGDDLKLGQPVALKFLPEGIGRDPGRLGRFHDEVRIARQVAHPNVCRVYDVGEVDDHHFLTMEYVDGEDLASLLRRIGRLPSDKGVQIARQISAGLAAAHDAGVLHRDLKPSNIMIDGRGRARITDFGLAALGAEVQGEDSRSGTPAYMAPEQLAGKGVSQRSDLYALGLVLYEIFTGRLPFSAASGAELLKQQTTSSPKSPSTVVEGVDPAVERVILRCLDPNPAGRPASALAVAAALPGGDPLAAALAAGETPSPELVAAGGESSGLSVRAAVAALGGVLLGLVLLVPLAARTQVIRLAPLEKPGTVLADRAREILRTLGYTEEPADSLSVFGPHRRYLQHLQKQSPPPRWSEVLDRSQPSAVHFQYRQSPRLLARDNSGSIGDWFNDPAPVLPGMAEVTLDPSGRLLALEVVPQDRLPAEAPAAEPSWSALLASAGFTEAALTRSDPVWVPGVFADRRQAWLGEYPAAPGMPVRIEAAALAGKVVAFRILEPWDAEADFTTPEFQQAPLIVRIARVFAFLTALLVAVFVAARNVRQGRGDRRGALRCALYLGGVRLLWMLGAHHLASDAEVPLLVAHLAWATYRMGMVGILYLALEPYARRLWPRMMVSWVRLLDGRFKDPLVGRDLLVGCLAGVLFALTSALFNLLPGWFGQPTILAWENFWAYEALRGFRHGVAALLGLHTSAALEMFFPLMLFLLFRLVFRRTWIAVAGTSLLGAVVLFPDTGNATIFLLAFGFTVTLFWFALFRYGLLAMVLGISLNEILGTLPLTLDLGSWYAPSGLLPLVVVAALALWGFRACATGRALFRDSVFGAEAAR